MLGRLGRVAAALLAALVLLVPAAPARAQARVEVDFWYALTQPLGGILQSFVDQFNASQTTYKVNGSFKGSYVDTMAAAIAAFRAGKAPHIVQIYEVGTATMMAAQGAVYPVYQLMKDTKTPFDPAKYIPAVRGYYSTADGKMVSMPFNSSTALLWYNKDAFRKAGLNPEAPPRTWAEVRAAAQKIKAAGAAKCAFSTSWLTWIQFEEFSALHNVPFATKANGFQSMDAELLINSPLHVRHLQLFLDMQKEGTFTYGGRDSTPDALFPSGECAIVTASSALRARVVRDAKFDWGVGYLPYYDDVKGAPLNSIIGGASFWVMRRPDATPEQYKAVAAFLRFLAQPEIDGRWHMETGYLPVTHTGFTLAQAQGYYRANPGADLAYKQMTRTLPTANSRGVRLGNLPEIRIVLYEEAEKALQGQQSAKQALDNVVQRGNEILRNFARTYK